MNPYNYFQPYKKSLAFVCVFALAIILRYTGINWDNGAHLHPDERFLTMVTTNISVPQNILQYFDTRASSFNPHNKDFSFYVYGTYPIHLTKLIAQALHKDTYTDIPFVGRSLSALMDILIVFFVFQIGKLLHEKTHAPKSFRAGLICALVYSILVLPIQLSHYYVVDPYAVLWITISLYMLLQKKLDWRLGIAVGLAISAKISSILILSCVVLTWISVKPWNMHGTQMRTMLRSLLGFFSMFYITVRIAYPYLFEGLRLNSQILNNWKELKAFDGPLTSFPPALQWIHVPFWQPTIDMLVWGLGLPLSGIFVMAIWYVIRKRQTHLYILLSWIVLIISYQSFQFAKPMRYVYPAYPAIAVLCGLFLSKIHISRFSTILFSIIVFIWPLSFIFIYQTPHTRITASTWIYEKIPPNATIAWEHWDDPLPLSIGENTITTYKTIQLPIYDPDSIEKWQSVSKTLASTDYIVLSSNRVYGGTYRAINRFPLTASYYTKLFNGSLGFTKIQEFTSRPTLPLPIRPICLSLPGFTYGILARTVTCDSPGIHFVDDYAEESFTVYDHPKVIILKNTHHLSSHEIFTHIYE